MERAEGQLGRQGRQVMVVSTFKPWVLGSPGHRLNSMTTCWTVSPGKEQLKFIWFLTGLSNWPKDINLFEH